MENQDENKSGEINSNIEEKKVFGGKKVLTKIKKNPWVVSTLVFGVVCLILFFGSSGITGSTIARMTGSMISGGEAGDSILDFVKSQTGGQGEVVEVNDFSDAFYEVTVLYQGQEVPLYITKDGKYLVQGLTPMASLQEPSSPNPQPSQPADVVKSDKPVVELFVMTHCPYGTQSEKGMIPAIKALGDSIDAEIRFVHYFMHDPEKTETPIQVCIREEQPAKYYDYLECFLEDGNSDRCLSKAKIDVSKMNACISQGKSDKYYKEDSDLSQGYGVGGSPSLVINGKLVNSGRDSASYLATICSAFNDAPKECEMQLSSSSPSPGFGTGTGASTSAQC